ncbi:MAG TPA: RidA family protein [Pyrinomonadaceae bacterium]|nr:RidA family protein [Pyrinomonadaceae bacterium]
MSFHVINPASLGRPRGYSNGLLTPPGVRLLFVAGQIGWDENQRLVGPDFVEQFDRALRNVLAVVAEAGGAPGSLARLTVYVTDKEEYRARTAELGERWRALLGRHYPAMALVEVKGLLEDGAKVEIEATAVL